MPHHIIDSLETELRSPFGRVRAMYASLNCGLHRFMLGTFVTIPVLFGCNSKEAHQSSSTELRHDEPGHTQTRDDDSLITIAAGVGTSDIRVGMPEDELMKYKKPSRIELVHKRGKHLEDLYYDQDGMIIRCLDRKVFSLQLYFRSEDRLSFRGVTKRGIGRDSSVRDTLCTYGKPTAVANTVESQFGKNPGTSSVEIDYYENGISFEFYDHKIATIVVFEPTHIRDPVLWRDIGDTSALRNMNCDDWKKPGNTE